MGNEVSDPIDVMRVAKDVARRCIVLYAVVAAGHNEPREQLVEWLQREGLWDYVTPKEQAFLESENPAKQQFINATWRVEALFPLLWALRVIKELPEPTALCDVEYVQSVLPEIYDSTAAFISSAQLRPDSEIYNANGHIIDIHWRIRDAEIRKNPPSPEPAGKLGRLPRMDTRPEGPPVEIYDAGVVKERHHALNWLTGYFGQEWDEVTTDT